jgi:hypothetical protein
MRALAVIVAIIAGLATLAAYFLPAQVPFLGIILNWALILAGTATLVGVFNLISIHGYKITRRSKGVMYSALLIVALFATFVFGLSSGPTGTPLVFIFNSIILPAQASLMAVLAITLLYAAIRLLRYKPNLMSVLFLVSVVLVLIGYSTLPFGDVPVIGDFIRPWMTQVLALGGARGILLGVALGTLVTGLRVLFAVDRPYGGGN